MSNTGDRLAVSCTDSLWSGAQFTLRKARSKLSQIQEHVKNIEGCGIPPLPGGLGQIHVTLLRRATEKLPFCKIRFMPLLFNAFPSYICYVLRRAGCHPKVPN